MVVGVEIHMNWVLCYRCHRQNSLLLLQHFHLQLFHYIFRLLYCSFHQDSSHSHILSLHVLWLNFFRRWWYYSFLVFRYRIRRYCWLTLLIYCDSLLFCSGLQKYHCIIRRWYCWVDSILRLMEFFQCWWIGRGEWLRWVLWLWAFWNDYKLLLKCSILYLDWYWMLISNISWVLFIWLPMREGRECWCSLFWYEWLFYFR